MQEEEQLEKARREQRRLDRQREDDTQRLRAEEERLRARREQEEAGLAAKAVCGCACCLGPAEGLHLCLPFPLPSFAAGGLNSRSTSPCFDHAPG